MAVSFERLHTSCSASEIIRTCMSRLEPYGTPVTIPASQVIAPIGEVCDCVYIIKKGILNTVRYTSNGGKRVFWDTHMVNACDYPIVLTAAVLTQMPPTVETVASTTAELIRIPRHTLLNAMLADPVIATGISLVLSSRFMDVKNTLHHSEELRFEPRFYDLLLHLADEFGEDYDGKILLKCKISQQYMADRLHVDRTTVARGVKRLKDEQLLERINDFYCIRNLKALRDKCD